VGATDQEADMASQRPHESADLEDFQVHGGSDTLDGAPGDDPLDRGVVAPARWSAGMRYGTTAQEQEAGESLDRLLAREEPDAAARDADRPEPGAADVMAAAGKAADVRALDVKALDENALDEDVIRFLLDDGPDPRAGRLVADNDGSPLIGEDDLAARDAGIDGGGASAEEAALHVVAEGAPGRPRLP
jgi:hypothetical protein